MAYQRRAGSFLLFIFIATGGGRAVRRTAAPLPEQHTVAEKMTVRGIKDFGKVDEYLYRGAQPKPKGIEELKKLGEIFAMAAFDYLTSQKSSSD